MIRFSRLISSIALCAALVLSACSVAETPADPASTDGPAIARIGWPGSPDSLNPASAILTEAFTIFELAYDTMFDLQLDNTYTLTLADSYTVSDDGLTWTFNVRSGVTFHDGEPMTAADIAFSYNLYKDHDDFPYLNSYTAYFADIQAPDDSTVVITLSEPIPNMESQLAGLYVLPEHIWSAVSEGVAAAEFANEQMIGTGPFKLVEYVQNEFVHLEAVKDHFLTPPLVDEIVFQTFANEDALVQAVQTGQVDMITEMPKTAVPALRNAENVVVATGIPIFPYVRDIIFNQITSENCPPDDGVCSGHPALLDRNVRLALAHATDKQNIIDVAELGLGSVGLTLVPEGLGFWYNDTIEDYAFDIDLANQILDDAGYLDTDNDGVRQMPDGTQPLIFRLQWPDEAPEVPRVAELIGQTWAQIGVRTEPQAMDPDALTAVCCPAFDFDVIIWGWGSDPDPGFILSVMTTDEIASGSSETGYSNPEYDALYSEQGITLDQDARKEMVWKMQEIVHNDVVYVVPYYQLNVQAYRTDRFTGWIIDQPKLALEDTSSLVAITPVE